MSMGTHDQPITPLKYEQFTAFNGAAVALSPIDASYALLQAETNDVRWRDDGVDPTSSVGMLLPVDQDFWYTGDVRKLRLIGVGADSILNVTTYR